MAYEDFRVEVLAPVGANRLDEVGEMITAPAEFLDLFAIVVPRDAAIEAHRAAFAINDHADALAAEVRRFFRVFGFREIVDLVENRSRRKIVVDDLSIGDVAGVVENESATDTHHPSGQPRLAQTPAGHVHLVNALVARFTVAGIPVETAIILQPVAVDRQFFSRTAPKIVVERLRDRQRRLSLAT